MTYSIKVLSKAEKQIILLPKKDQRKILKCLSDLKDDPRPNGVKKLKGNEAFYRIRQGNFRIVYEIEDKKLLILIVKVGHRKDVYY